LLLLLLLTFTLEDKGEEERKGEFGLGVCETARGNNELRVCSGDEEIAGEAEGDAEGRGEEEIGERGGKLMEEEELGGREEKLEEATKKKKTHRRTKKERQ
jgi:hypothetical protein